MQQTRYMQSFRNKFAQHAAHLVSLSHLSDSLRLAFSSLSSSSWQLSCRAFLHIAASSSPGQRNNEIEPDNHCWKFQHSIPLSGPCQQVQSNTAVAASPSASISRQLTNQPRPEEDCRDAWEHHNINPLTSINSAFIGSYYCILRPCRHRLLPGCQSRCVSPICCWHAQLGRLQVGG